MKSQRKKKEKGQPGGLRSYKVMLPETYRRTRRPVWFEGTHLQVFQDSEQGVIPMIYRGKREWLLEYPHWGVEGCELDWERAITPVKKGQPGLEWNGAEAV